MSTRAPQFYDFLHFKGCSYLNCEISFNLSVEVAIFLVFHNPFMMLFHILMSVSDHDLMLDNFLLRSSVLITTIKEHCISNLCERKLSLLVAPQVMSSKGREVEGANLDTISYTEVRSLKWPL